MEFENEIEDSFRKGGRPLVTTVGELLAELQQLPPDLPLYADFEDGIRVGVTNVNGHHLACSVRPDEED